MISKKKIELGFLLFAVILAILWAFFDIDLEPQIALLTLLSSLIIMSLAPISKEGMGYSCGHRLKTLREEVGLSPSAIVELFNLESESKYASIESGQSDVPNELIELYRNKFGVNSNWIRHGSSLSTLQQLPFINLFHEEQKTKYDKMEANIYNKSSVDKTIAEIFATKPEQLYLCIAPESCGTLILVVGYSEYCWKLWDLHSLNFWALNWLGETKTIPYIYHFITQLREKSEYKLHGLFATNKQMFQLYTGNHYPLNIIRSIQLYQYKKLRKRYSNIQSWPDDILDISYASSSKATYQQWYGEWFIDVQYHFRETKKIFEK